MALDQPHDVPRVCTSFAEMPLNPQERLNHGPHLSSLFASWPTQEGRDDAARGALACLVQMPCKYEAAVAQQHMGLFAPEELLLG